jgi:lipoyl(octanoyl) transferase
MTPDAAFWRLVLGDGRGLQPADGPTNMAIDSALLASVRAGSAPVVRLYRWSPACLSFGRNQPARGLYDLAGAARRGIQFVRRPTGGQAVLHDVELTYAVVAPIVRIGRPRAAYRRINEALVAGLRSLGVPAELVGAAVPARPDPGREAPLQGPAPRGPAAGTGPGAGPHPWTEACFRRPAPGEVVARGLKLVGSAQRSEGGVILQHGSLLMGGSQAAAEELLTARPRGTAPGAAADGVPGWTTLEAELERCPDSTALVAALTAGIEAAFGTSLAPSTLLVAEAAAVDRLRARFASAAWTWRR